MHITKMRMVAETSQKHNEKSTKTQYLSTWKLQVDFIFGDMDNDDGEDSCLVSVSFWPRTARKYEITPFELASVRLLGG